MMSKKLKNNKKRESENSKTKSLCTIDQKRPKPLIQIN